MKLRNYLGLSIRIYFGLVRYSIFFDVLLLIILSNLGFPDKVCVIVFFVFILGWIAWIYSIKCPKCNTRIASYYNFFSKYYKPSIFRIPKTCPCCGIDLDEV